MNPITNWQFYLIYRCISTSQNQIHLDSCRKMIEMWFLNKGEYKRAEELYNAIQVRECELIYMQESLILESNSI